MGTECALHKGEIMIETITKRNGKVVPWDADKANGWAEWSCEGAIGVSWSLILSKAIKAGYDGMTSADWQQALINACVSLIQTNSEYEKPAAKLYLANLRKSVFGTFQPPKFSDFYHDMVERGLWEDMHFDEYKLKVLNGVIDHDRDKLFPYSGLRQMGDKYLMNNQVSGEIYESPQMLYMGLAMAGMTNNSPLDDVIDLYHSLSKLQINIPTPVLLGLRSPLKGFASCCIIAGGDSVDSMDAAEHVAYKMVANRAGIGLDFETRGILEPVKGGMIEHQGKLPYYKWLDRSIKANTQQARGGSATMQFPVFDPEVMTLLRLRSQRVSDDKRIDTMDYSLAISNYFLGKLARGEQIALISPYYAKKAHQLFYTKDVDGFIEAYETAVDKWKDEKVIKTRDGFISPVKWVDARELFSLFIQQRADTGRIYCVRVDEANRRSTFKDSIRSSNLCQEILLPTHPHQHIMDVYSDTFDPEVDGEVALCNLGGIVINRISSDAEYARVAYLLLKLIDNVISMQVYSFPSMKASANYRRSVGVGMINLAHALAQQGLGYDSNEGRTFMHEQAERMSYFLHKASIQLAAEQGACEGFDRTTYSEGIFPHESALPIVESFHDADLKYDWDALRSDMAEFGMRNSVLEAYMPSESSSVTIGATNGIEPPRNWLMIKASRQGDIPQIVPDYAELQFDYQYAFDISPKDKIKSMAVLQKFIGQSISYNVEYDYNKYPGAKLPMGELLQDFMFACKAGLKTFYYFNTEGDNGGSASNKGQNCDTCTL